MSNPPYTDTVAAGPGVRVIVNPGTGPVPDATLAHAQAAAEQLCVEAGLQRYCIERHAAGDAGYRGPDGRFGFRVHVPGCNQPCPLRIPGVPLPLLAYRGEPGQKIFNFPRLYLDGGSWVWLFAVDLLRSFFANQEPAAEPEGAHS